MIARFFDVHKLRTVILLVAFMMAMAVAQQPSASPSPQQVPTIFSYKAELGLTDDQVTRMQARLKALQTSVTSSREKLQALQKEYQTLVGNETTPLPTIEAKLKEIAAVQVASQIEDLKASRDILAIMSADQLKKWRGIQAAARAQNTPK